MELPMISTLDATEFAPLRRVWAMPTADTFDCPPIGAFVGKYLRQAKVSIDPFARNKQWATYTNDLNPGTKAAYHMDARDFLQMLVEQGVRADLVLIDPPYSPRQLKECYDSIGLTMTTEDGWTAHTRKLWKELIHELVTPDGIVLTFGWNSVGMGRKYGFGIAELLLICHGADHNDTICLAERRIQGKLI